MKNFSRLRIVGLVEAVGLRRCQIFENPTGDSRVDPERLQRGDDAVASERCTEPRHARIGIRPMRRIGHQHAEIGARAANPLVEALAG